jgi:opacity protein-like surface antigen
MGASRGEKRMNSREALKNIEANLTGRDCMADRVASSLRYAKEALSDAPRINAIRIEHMPDDNPDFNHLGRYSNKPGPADRTVDRYPDGTNWTYRQQMRYFIAANSAEETGNPDSVEQDYQRMEAYNRQEWSMLGIRAVADVSYDVGDRTRRIERFTSAGLWGVESDSDADYLTSVASDELADLKAHLEHFGIDLTNFDALAEAALAAPVTR